MVSGVFPAFAFLAGSHGIVYDLAKNTKIYIPMHFWVPQYYLHF